MDADSLRPTTVRRFTLLDVMILVAAAAMGLAATRWFDPAAEWGELIKALAANFPWNWDLIEEINSELMPFVMPAAVTMSLGVLAMQLRKPRHRWQRLARQPGMVACLALALSWIAAGAHVVVNVLLNPPIAKPAPGIPPGTAFVRAPLSFLQEFTVVGSILCGFAVVVAWSTLVLVGRWRPEPTWLDRLGRLVGLTWVGMALAGWFVIRAGVF